MNFDLSDEQKMLKDQIARLLADISPPDRLRTLIDGRQDWDAELWRRLSHMGVLGAAIPEEYGGLGLGEVELCVIAEEIGRAVAAVPFFSSICMAAEAIRLAGTQAQKQKWLPLLASGEAVGCLAYSEGLGPAGERLEASVSANGLTGAKWPVADAGVARVAVVAARQNGRVVLGLVDLKGEGVASTRLVGFDELRPHYRLDFTQAAFEPMGEADANSTLSDIYVRAAAYVAFEQVGGAEACLWMARDYALERRVFGRQLASYQAVKHNLANVFVNSELARSNAYWAAWAMETGSDQLEAAASTARIAATRAYEHAARENLQIHGGIGFTWAGDCHFHFRRARLLALNIGAAEQWSDRLVRALDRRAPPPAA